MVTTQQSNLQVLVKKTFKECLIRGLDDPVAFAHDFLDVSAHPGQEAWLNTRNDAKERMLHCSNRWGKSAVAGIKLLHRAFYQGRDTKYTFDPNGRLRPYICANIAMSMDQARIAWDYALQYASNSPRFSRFVVKSDFSPFPVMWIENAGKGKDKVVSEIWARSTAKRAKYLLGKNFAFLNYDEAAFDADGEIVWNDVLRMRLADQAGDIDFTSTPNLKNWFYKQCEKGRAQSDGTYPNARCYTQKGSTFENPYVDHDFIRETMKYMTDVQRQQNVYGEFASALSIFNVQYVEACYRDHDYRHLMGDQGIPCDHEVEYIETDQGQLAKLRRLRVPAKYVIGADLARKRDNTVIVVLRVDCEPALLMSYRVFSRTNWKHIKDEIRRTHQKYNAAPILVDSTGAGDGPLESLQTEYELPAEGYNFAGSGREKENLVIHLQEAIQNQRIGFPFIRELYDQLIYYDWNDKKLQTDSMFGLALAWECALRVSGRKVFSPGDNTLMIATASTNYITGRRVTSLPNGRQILPEDELEKLRQISRAERRRRYDDGEDLDANELGVPIVGLL